MAAGGAARAQGPERLASMKTDKIISESVMSSRAALRDRTDHEVIVVKERTSAASEPRERSGAWGPRERPPTPRLRRGLAEALRAKAEACGGESEGQAPRLLTDERFEIRDR